MIKAVVFDMDGVLFDTERMGSRAWQAVADRMGLPEIEAARLGCVGLNRNDEIVFLKNWYGQDFPMEHFLEESTQEMERLTEEEGVPLKQGVREILAYLMQQDIPVAICSSSRVDKICSNLKHVQIPEHYFQAIIGGDLVQHSKPKPDIYLKACEALGLAPESCIAVEDSPNGIRAAYEAGMQVVMIPDMIMPTPELLTMCIRKEESLGGLQRFLEQRK